MPSNKALTDEYFAIMNDECDGDITGRRDAFHYMQSSTAIVKKRVVASSFIPRLFNDQSWQAFNHPHNSVQGYYRISQQPSISIGL